MRSPQEIEALLLETARSDERVRAVVLSGSRANPNAVKDRFQDFDVTYLVTDVAPFRNNPRWMERFGEILIQQLPEAMVDPPPSGDGSFVYLTLFTDGNRIDLSVFPLDRLAAFEPDSLSVVLLDKDGILPPLPPASERDYLPQPPTAKAFDDCCNEFWWVSTYVAKALCRDELPLAKHLLDTVVREQLTKMLVWYVGVRTEFRVNPGKSGRYLKRYLEPEFWALLERTYADADLQRNWAALAAMGTLFRTTALAVAQHDQLRYPHDDDQRVTAYLDANRP